MEITCRLCKHSRQLKKKSNGRYCQHADTLTTFDTKACPAFVCDGLFYCPYIKKYMGITTCMRRAKERRNNRSTCRDCEYGQNGDTILLLMQTAETTVLRRR